MPETWEEVESIWHGKFFSFMLPILGLSLVIWAALSSPSPGVSIGLLAGAAGIMSLRTEKMHPAEKTAWVVILVAFTILEVVAIRRADQDNKEARAAQNEAFKEIADGLKTSIGNSKSQYDSTIEHVNGVLDTTKQVAGLAEDNLRAITGGKTFAYIVPENFYGNRRLFVALYAVGKDNLTSVSVNLSRVRSISCPPGLSEDSPGCSIRTGLEDAIPHDVGTLMGGEGRTMHPDVHIDADSDYSAHYIADIYAQNGISFEHIWLRKGANGEGAAYRILVYWYDKNDWKRAKIVKRTGWVEPMQQQ